MHNDNNQVSEEFKRKNRNKDKHPYKTSSITLCKDLFFLFLFWSVTLVYPNNVVKWLTVIGVITAGIKCIAIAMAHALGGTSHKLPYDDIKDLSAFSLQVKIWSLRSTLIVIPALLIDQVILFIFFAFYLSLIGLSFI